MVVRYMKNGPNERRKGNEKDIDLLFESIQPACKCMAEAIVNEYMTYVESQK